MASNVELGNVLVVGGCGFLGYHIVQHLLDSGRATVSVFDITTSRNRLPSVSYSAGDLCSKTDVETVLAKEKPSVIIHTASPPANPPMGLAIYEKVNVEGTRNLLTCAQECGTVKAFVFTSSASVVHDYVSNLVDADESLPVLRMPEQREPYSHTKGLAEELVVKANGTNNGMLTCSLRPAGLFGERDSGTLTPLVINAKAGKTRFQIGDGTNRFDFTYISNAADAHLLAAEALVRTHDRPKQIQEHQRVDGQEFFITNGEPTPFWQFARDVGAAAGYPTPDGGVWVIPRWLGLLIGSISEWVAWALGKKLPTMTRQAIRLSTITRTYRIDKARKRLGYNPKIGLQEAIKRSGQWWIDTQEKIVGKKER